MTRDDAIQAYCKTQTKTGTPREVEAAAFLRSARLLVEARAHPGDREKYASALKTNRLLWSLIQAGVADRDSLLPPEIRYNILSLSLFVDRQTSLALAEHDVELLELLIFINTELAQGLTARPDRSGG